MNKRQQLFLVMLFSKLSLLLAIYSGFWAFIHDVVFLNIPFSFGIMRNAVNFVLFTVFFFGWVTLDMWIKDQSTMPTFKIERDEKQGKNESAKEEKEEKLPLY